MTSLAKDRIDHAGGSTIEPPFEVNTSARGSYRISLRRVVTSSTPWSVACMEMYLVVLGLAQGGRQRCYGPRCHGDYFLADRRTRVGVSVKCGPDGGGWRIEKCGWINADDKMRMEKCG